MPPGTEAEAQRLVATDLHSVARARDISYQALIDALARGYAASSSDTRHRVNNAGFAVGHPEKLIDFGSRAVHLMTETSKTLLAEFYGSPARTGTAVDASPLICDVYRMAREPISVTLAAENIVWLKGRAAAAGIRSVSELLDQLVTAARSRGHETQRRTVVHSISIAESDAGLDDADRAIRRLFTRSLNQPMAVHEDRPAYGKAPKRKTKRRA